MLSGARGIALSGEQAGEVCTGTRIKSDRAIKVVMAKLAQINLDNFVPLSKNTNKSTSGSINSGTSLSVQLTALQKYQAQCAGSFSLTNPSISLSHTDIGLILHKPDKWPTTSH